MSVCTKKYVRRSKVGLNRAEFCWAEREKWKRKIFSTFIETIQVDFFFFTSYKDREITIRHRSLLYAARSIYF